MNERELSKIEPGDSFLAANGKVYLFVSCARDKIIGQLEGKRYKIPSRAYIRLVQKNADPELARSERDAEAKKKANKDVLRTLRLGDQIRCNDGLVYSFPTPTSLSIMTYDKSKTITLHISVGEDGTLQTRVDAES